MDSKVKYWIELSEYDLDTAEAMLTGKRYLYVGFMCHQSIEKVLKALYTQVYNDVAPFTHSLSYLAEKTGISSSFSEDQKSAIFMLEPLNIEARYPADKEKILKSLSHQKCIEIINISKNLHQWIKAKL